MKKRLKIMWGLDKIRKIIIEFIYSEELDLQMKEPLYWQMIKFILVVLIIELTI